VVSKLDDNFIDYNSLSSLDLKKYEVIYNKNLNKFSNLIDKLASCYKEDLSWLVQSVLSKNKSLSNVYFEYCKLEILKIRLKKNFYNKIIVNDKAQKKLIEANFSNNFTLEFIIKKTSTNVYLNVIKNLILNIKFGFILFMNKSRSRKKFFLKKKNITVIENFFYLREENKEEYTDRYYGNLLSFINQKNISIFFLFQALKFNDLKYQISFIKKSKINFITIFDFLKLSDYINAIIKIHCFKRIDKKKIFYNDLNLTSIFYDEYKKTFNDLNAFYGLLQFLFFKRLKKETNPNKIKTVVDWYENQSIDKGFNLGLNLFFPKVKTIGYQAFAVDYNYYCHLLPSKEEIKNKLAPKKIAFIGKAIMSYATKRFKLNRSNLILGPALRFNNIFHKKNIIKKKSKKNNVLLALPVGYNDSEDIILLTNSYIKKYPNNNCKFYINYHPMLNFDELKKSYGLKKKFSILKKNFNENFQMFDCIVSNSSSICFESLAHGIPVVIVKSKTRITHNPISNVKNDVWKSAQNVSQFKDTLNYFFQRKNKRQLSKISNIIKRDYFTANNKINVTKLLGIN
jgi:hypothetical protein